MSSIKVQNAQITELKKEFTETLEVLDFIIHDVIETTLGDTEPNDLQINAAIEYLYGNISLKEFRARLKSSTCPPHISESKCEKVSTQKVVKVPTKKVSKPKSAK